jgi:DNA helicase IV
MENYKEKLLKQVKSHIDFVRQKIQDKLEIVKVVANQSLKELSKLSAQDQAIYMNGRGNAYKRIAELEHLNSSPYFMKTEIIDESGKDKEYFFAKHEFSKQSIYSWVAPVSVIRFENPGKTSYRLPNGKIRTVTIKQKETYMIVDGKVLLFALETQEKARELIYQEHFTKQKSEFILPEIVAQMEKAQDQVIRAGHKGPLVISGPAGSGKTTLALHRVAYLTQVPDTALIYKSDSILVLVQDNGTKNYFSTLLPSLGINDVKITTFSEWALKVLNIENYFYIERYGENEEEKDLYEYQKLKALRETSIPAWSKNIFTTLNSKYSEYFSDSNLRLFNEQKKERKLDRFDLVILLKSYLKKYEKFEIKREYQTFVKNKLTRKIEKTEVLYSLMIVDEFQNYLPEQIQILKNCLNQKKQSVVYVGDMAQQVKLGTIRDWKEVKEVISPDRNIKLKKVYRNTRNILSFIKSLGYVVELPIGLKEGPVVVEKIINTVEEEIRHIKEIIPKYTKGTIGILAKEETYLENFKKEFTDMKNIHVLTMNEAQGVEFDLVCLVGIKKESFVTHNVDVSPLHIEEKKRIQKDLLYVALTRAITELHILGIEKLSSISD